MSKVKIIAHPETGKLFTETSNSDVFKCQIQSLTPVVTSSGFSTVEKRTAFPPVNKLFVDYCKSIGLKSGMDYPIQGKIVRKVTSEPQYPNQKQVMNPKTKEEMGYYQSYTFTTDVNAYDVDERIAVSEAKEVSSLIEANTAFSEE